MFNFARTGRGRATMRRSWIMLIALFAYATLLKSIHVPPRISLFQKNATGRHEKIVMKNMIVVLTTVIAIVAIMAYRIEWCGKRRR